MERGLIQGLPKFFGYPLLSQERVKLRTSNFVGTFIESIGTKAHENFGNSGRGRSQAVPKIFRAPMCRAHCAAVFAIAQLSCSCRHCTLLLLLLLVWSLVVVLRLFQFTSLNRSSSNFAHKLLTMFVFFRIAPCRIFKLIIINV